MISGKDFVALVRKNTPDMDDKLSELFNKCMSDYMERAYDRAFFFFKRQRDFARKNQAKFWEEFNDIRNKVTKLGYFGTYLDDLCLDIYTNDLDVESYVNKMLEERKIRQESYQNQSVKSSDNSTQNKLFE